MNGMREVLEKKARKVDALERICAIDASVYRAELEGEDKPIRTVSWDEVSGWLDSLAENVGRWNGVYGVPKAGLVLAVALANRMHLPLLMAPENGCLVIEDVANTGLSLFPYMGRFEIACMFDCGCQVPIDYSYEETAARVVFPWS